MYYCLEFSLQLGMFIRQVLGPVLSLEAEGKDLFLAFTVFSENYMDFRK